MKNERFIEVLTVEPEDPEDISQAVSMIFKCLDHIREETEIDAKPAKHTA